MDAVVHSVRDKLVAKGISNKVYRAHGAQTGRSLFIPCVFAWPQIDLSGAPIGRRYARTDQIGIPFAVTVDFQTLDPNHRFSNTVHTRAFC